MASPSLTQMRDSKQVQKLHLTVSKVQPVRGLHGKLHVKMVFGVADLSIAVSYFDFLDGFLMKHDDFIFIFF